MKQFQSILVVACLLVSTMTVAAFHHQKSSPFAVKKASYMEMTTTGTANNNYNCENNNDHIPLSSQDKFKTQQINNLYRLSSIGLGFSILSGNNGVAHADDAAAAPAAEVIDNIITLDSGLKYIEVVQGTGAVPKSGDTVRVHYTGWLDGFDGEKKFDSSYDRRSPLVFKVGVHQVIAGWDEGILAGLKVGGKRNLIIPPELGYGTRGAGGVIPPNATLYFKIELVGIGAR